MVGRKRKKKRTGDICKGTRNIEFEQDSSVGLGAILVDGQKIKVKVSPLQAMKAHGDVNARVHIFTATALG